MTLPSAWQQARLGCLVDILDSRRVPVSAAERAKRQGSVPYYGAAGQVGTIDEALFNEPLVLLGEDGVQFFDPNKTKAYEIQGPAWVNNHAHVLRARPAVERRFLLHFLNVFDYRDYANGTTRLKLTQAAMRAIPVPLPSLAEQRRIVELLESHLSRLDAALGSLDHGEHLLSGLRERVVWDAITGAATLGPRHRDVPAAEGVEDGTLASLPEGWQWHRLRDVAQVVGGVTKDSGRQNDPAFVEVPYLRVANVQRGRLTLERITHIRVAPGKAQSLRLMPGDVLMNEGGDRDKLGRGWVWEGQVEDCIHQNHVFRARVIEGLLHPKLLSWAANTIGGRWCEQNGKQSVNLASISLTKIRLMPVPVPPSELQEAIVQCIDETLTGCNRLQDALTAQRRKLLSLRRGLLAAAFSGRLTNAASISDGLDV